MDTLREGLESGGAALERLALSLVGDEHEAADLVQETWVTALRRKSAPPRDALRWARVVLRRLFYDELRQRALREHREREAGRAASIAPSLEEQLERGASLAVVSSSVDGLAEPYRTVIHLRYWGDLTPTQIARKLDRPLDTVQTQLRRGLGQLREQLDREHGGRRAAWAVPLAARWREGRDGGEAPRSAGPLHALRPALLTLGVVALSVAVFFAWTAGGRGVRAEESVPVTKASAPTEVRAREPVPAGARDTAPGLPPTPSGSSPPLPEPPLRRLLVTVVDPDGDPVPDAAIVVLRGASNRARGSTAVDGTLELVIEDDEVGIADYPGFEEHTGVC